MRFNEFTSHTVTEGYLDNPGQQDSPVASAITRRILLQRTDLLSKYGPEKVGAAVDEVADFVGDVDEIGSSDVSGWIRHVEQMLGNMAEGVAEGLGKDIKRLATGKDVKSRAGQEIAKSQDASMKGDTKTSKKHFDRYDKLDKLANKEQGVAEGSGFDKWADDRAASQLHKLKKPHPETWHDVDKKLGKAVDKMSQAEKVKKGLAHPDTLKKKGVAEAGQWSKMDAYQRDYAHSVAGMPGRRHREDDEHHEIDRRREEQLAQYATSGKFWLKFKDSGKHVSDQHYIGKAAATAAAHEMMRNNPEVKGNLLLTAYGPNGE